MSATLADSRSTSSAAAAAASPNCIRMAPPLTISDDEIDLAAEILDASLTAPLEIDSMMTFRSALGVALAKADAEWPSPTPSSAQDAGELDEALLRAISHPLRHRLLGMLDGRTASPNMLARELGLPLGRVSYHIRLLNDLGAIELVRTEPRRGALEHFYRAVTTVWFSEARLVEAPALGPPRDPRPEPAAHLRQRDRGRRRRRLRQRRERSSCARRSSSTRRACTELSELLRDSLDRAREINARAAERARRRPRPPKLRDPAFRAPRRA